MNPLIQDFQDRVRAVTDASAVISLNNEVFASVGLSGLPSWMLPDSVVKVTEAITDVLDEDAIRLSGTIAHPNLGVALLTLNVQAIDGSLRADVEFGLKAPLPLAAFLIDAGLDVPGIVNEFLHTDTFSSVKSEWRSGQLRLNLQMKGDHTLRLGPITIRVELSQANIVLSPPALESVVGSLRIGNQILSVALPITNELEFHVDSVNMTVAGLFDELGIELPPLPPLPIVSQPLSGLLIERVDGAVCLGATQRISGVGTLTVSVSMHDGQLGGVLTLLPMAGLRFSTMHVALAPFDALLDIVSFGDPSVVLSTVSATDFPIVDAAGRWTLTSVEVGAAFFGQLHLDGFGLEVVKGVLGGIDRLPFLLPINESLSDLHIKVDLFQQIELLPGVLLIDRFMLNLVPEPLNVNVNGTAHLTLFGEQLPTLVLGAAVSPDAYSFFLKSAEVWEHPLGLPFNVEELGLQIDGPVIAYGLFGKVALTQTKASLATKFIGNAPTFLAAALDGELSMQILLKDLVGIDLPIPFEPKLRDASIYVVVNPLGETIATRHYPRGIGLKGTITFLSFSASLSAAMNEQSISARAAFNEPVRMLPLLEMTGFGGADTPVISIDSGHDPICMVSARVTVLGVMQDLHAEVGTDHVVFDFDSVVGPVKTQFKATLGDGTFNVAGTASFGLKGAIGPLTLGAGLPSLGTLQLDVQASAMIAAGGDNLENAGVKVSAGFNVGDIEIEVPEIEVDIQSIEQLPQAILEYIQRNATDILKALISTADVWLKAIAQGIIVGVQNVAKVLLDQFQQNIEVVTDVLINTLRVGVDEAAKQLRDAGQTVTDIATSLANLNQVPNAIRGALEALNVPAEEISKALQAAFPGIPHADFAAVPHADVGAKPHADVHGVHTDIGATHTDGTAGHTDGTTGHTDVRTGHTDEGGGWVPHLDIGGIHTDLGGLHTDIAGIHTDFGIAHTDTEIPPHLDTAASVHIDTPETLHVDAP